MRTLFIILGIWLLINVLFVVVMIPPRRPRTANVARGSGVAIGMKSGTTETQDESVLLRHVVIAIALGAFFSLTPPLLEAYDAIKGLVSKRVHKLKETPDRPNGDAQADEG